MDHRTPTRGNFVFGVVFVLVLGGLIWFRGMSRGPDVEAHELEAFAQGLTVASATQAASGSGKPVFVYASASWCGPCRAFKSQTLARPEVASALLSGFEPVYLDIDRESDVARDLRVRVVPTLMVLRDGQQVDRVEGGLGTSEFLEFLRRNATVEPGQ